MSSNENSKLICKGCNHEINATLNGNIIQCNHCHGYNLVRYDRNILHYILGMEGTPEIKEFLGESVNIKDGIKISSKGVKIKNVKMSNSGISVDGDFIGGDLIIGDNNVFSRKHKRSNFSVQIGDSSRIVNTINGAIP